MEITGVERRELGRETGGPMVGGVRGYAEYLPGRAMSPGRLSAILRDAAAGDLSGQALLFEDMEEKDAHIFAEISKRKRAVSGRSWAVLPGDDAPRSLEAADFCQRVLDDLGVEDLLLDLGDAIGKGFSCLELIWDFSSGQGRVVRAEQRPQGWFTYLPQRPGELRLIDGTAEGVGLPPLKWIIHRHRARSGSPYRAALYRVLAWLYLFRNYGLKAWAQFVEGFGIPLRVGKYPPGTPEEEQARLLEAVSSIASEAAVVIPEGMAIDIVEAAGSRGNPHRDFLEWSEREISKAILGATLTSSAQGSGSYALGQVHEEVRRDILASDARQMQGALGRGLLRPMTELNFGPETSAPYLRIDLPESENLSTLADVLKTLSEAGFRDIPTWWIRDRFGIPASSPGEPTLGALRPGQ